MKNERNKKIVLRLGLSFIFLGLFVFVQPSLAGDCPSRTTVEGNRVNFVGELTDTGGADVNYVWFEYGRNTSYYYKTTEKALSQEGLYCIEVSGLEPCTTYHYRAAARNEAGTSYGEDKTFTTSCDASVTLKKTVRNLSDGTDFAESVAADPTEVLNFSIEVSVNEGSVSNLILKDEMPDRINYRSGSLTIDGESSTGDVFSGINLGQMSAGDKKTIVFTAYLADRDQFSLGENKLVNKAEVTGDDVSVSDTAEVIVTKKAVAGAVTDISTGLTNNFFVDSFFLPLLITFLILWLLKSKIVKFEQWIDKRKKEYYSYKSQKVLQLKTKQIRLQEFLKSRLEKEKGFVVLILDLLFVAAGIALLLYGLLQNQGFMKAMISGFVH